MNLTSFNGLIESLAEFDAAFVALGDNKTRLSKSRALMLLDLKDSILVNSRSAVSKTAQLQAGTLIGAGVAVMSDDDSELVVMGVPAKERR